MIKPTRCTSSSASCIDHFISNFSQNKFETCIITTRISDHFPIVFFRDTPKNESKPKFITKQDFSDQNVNKFSNLIKNIKWQNVTQELDPNHSFKMFSEQFDTFHSNFFAPKRIKFNQSLHKKEKWMTAGILESRLTKLDLQKKA